jgi:hypothetical protein
MRLRMVHNFSNDYLLAKHLAWVAKVSLTHLCRCANVSPLTVRLWRGGKTRANMDTIRRLQEASKKIQIENDFAEGFNS